MDLEYMYSVQCHLALSPPSVQCHVMYSDMMGHFAGHSSALARSSLDYSVLNRGGGG